MRWDAGFMFEETGSHLPDLGIETRSPGLFEFPFRRAAFDCGRSSFERDRRNMHTGCRINNVVEEDTDMANCFILEAHSGAKPSPRYLATFPNENEARTALAKHLRMSASQIGVSEVVDAA